jgi:hypothetical protein
LDHAGKHLRDLFQSRPQFRVFEWGNEAAAKGNFKQRDALLRGSSGDGKTIPAIGLRESAVAFGDISGNGYRGAVELIDKKIVPTRKCFGSTGNFIRFEKFDGLRSAPPILLLGGLRFA